MLSECANGKCGTAAMHGHIYCLSCYVALGGYVRRLPPGFALPSARAKIQLKNPGVTNANSNP